MSIDELEHALTEATRAVEAQKKIVREAEVHLIKLEDEKRNLWVQLQNAKKARGPLGITKPVPPKVLKEFDREAKRAGRRNQFDS